MSDWREPWLRARERIADIYGRNIATMMSALDGHTARLRPHTKVQKSPDIALMQVEAGAIGVTVASVWEGAAMAAAGVGDILIANELVPPDRVAAAAALAAHTSLTLAVDDARNIEALSAAMTGRGTEADVLVDLDVGMARCGARSPEQALALARQVQAAPGLRLRGVMAYEGHCMLE